MANNGAKQALQESGLSNPTPQTNQKKALIKRRTYYSSSKTAPASLANNNVLHQASTILPSEPKFQPSLRDLGIFMGVYQLVGTICFYLVRHSIKGKKTNGLLDSLYLCMTTMTTVGYGDLVPDSFTSKVFASVLAFGGMVLVGLILKKAASYLLAKQEFMLVKALNMCQKLGLTESLKAIDEETSRVKYQIYVVLGVISGHMGLGMLFLSLAEELDMGDCFYCVCSTITTLGYGDKSFQTPFGRFFAFFWILTSTTSLAHFFFHIVELFTEEKQKELVKTVLTWKMTNIDLEAAAADVDYDHGAVGSAEFILCKLKEKGKISQEDVSVIMEEFEESDVDQKGTMVASGVMLAKSFEAGR